VTAGFADDVDNIDGQTSYAPACSQVGLLDLATGELGPLTEVEGTYDEEAPVSAQDGMAVEVLGDTVMVAWSSTVVGLNPSDLSEGWRWTPESRRGADSSCIILDLAPTGPDQAVLLSACIPADSLDLVDDYFLDELSVTGQVSRSRQITAEEAQVEMDELAGVELISAAPLVVEVSRAPGGGDADGDRSLLAFDDSWELQNAIHDERTTRSADENLYTEPVGYLTRSGPWRRPNRTLVAGGTLVSFTTPEGEANELVAVDLRTGENVWTAPTEPGHLVWQVLAVDDETAIAVVREDGGPGQSIMYVDMATGDVQDTRTTEVPSPDGGSSDTVDPARFGYVFADDRAYGVDFNLRPGDEAASWLAFTVG
jgi:hypothetical protein